MITSTANGHIRKLIQLREKSRTRSKEGLFLAEGIRMFEETPIESLKEIYCSESFFAALQTKSGQTEGSQYDKVLQKLHQCEECGIFTEQVSAGRDGRTADGHGWFGWWSWPAPRSCWKGHMADPIVFRCYRRTIGWSTVPSGARRGRWQNRLRPDSRHDRAFGTADADVRLWA